MAKKSRNSWIKVRVNEDEKEHYRYLSALAGMPLSDLVRQQMERPIVAAPRPKQRRLRTETADPKLMRQLAAMGSNLNQLARAVNTHGLRPDDAAMVLTYLAGIQAELRLIRDPAVEEGGDDAPQVHETR